MHMADDRTMKTMQQEDETSVTDLNVASFLLARDFPIIRVEGSTGQKTFVFQGVPQDELMAFYAGRALVDARKLFSAFRDVKGLALQRF
jgi:hypothetical protein